MGGASDAAIEAADVGPIRDLSRLPWLFGLATRVRRVIRPKSISLLL